MRSPDGSLSGRSAPGASGSEPALSAARTVTAAADCEQAAAETVLALADAHMRLGAGVAAAKFEVLCVVTELAYELSREAVKIIIGVGLLCPAPAWSSWALLRPPR